MMQTTREALAVHRGRTMLLLALALAVATPGCNRTEKKRVAALEATVATLDGRVLQLEAELRRAEFLGDGGASLGPPVGRLPIVDPSSFTLPVGSEPAPPATPEPDVASATGAEGDDASDGGLVAEIDDDLADLEAQVDADTERIEALRQTVAQLGVMVDDHAAGIDDLNAKVDQLTRENQYLRDLAGVVSIEDGNVVISQADLILRQGTRSDGFPDGRGRLYQQVVPAGGH